MPPPPAKLPESLLIALGLTACDPKGGGRRDPETETAGPCLQIWYHSGAAADSVGPCLTQHRTDTGTGAPSDTSGASTDTVGGTGAAGGTDTWSGTDSVDTGPCLDTSPRPDDTADTGLQVCLSTDTSAARDSGGGAVPAPVSNGSPVPDPLAVRARLLDAETLPPDVVTRLKAPRE